MTIQQAPESPALLLQAVRKAWCALTMSHGRPQVMYEDTGVGLLPMVTKIYAVPVSTKMWDPQVPG